MDNDEHEKLIDKGLKFYDAFEYQKALPYLEKAYRIAPKCICAMYNFANVLHMLGREEEAHNIILNIIKTTPKEAKINCKHIYNARGFIIDAHFLMFNVLIHGQGFSDEAFSYANKHLELRTRGVGSVWTKKQVIDEVAFHLNEWKNEA